MNCSSQKLATSTFGKVRLCKLSEIHEAFETFYKGLHARVPGGSIVQINTFLNLHLPTIIEEQNQKSMVEIPESKLQAAISRLKVGISPGSDGYTAERYFRLKTLVLIILSMLDLEKSTNTFQLERGNYFSHSIRRQGYSLKLWPNVLKCLRPNWSTMIRQVLYINVKHKIIYNGCYILWILKTTTEATVISIDAEKAFSLSWESRIIKTILALYSTLTARVKVNGIYEIVLPWKGDQDKAMLKNVNLKKLRGFHLAERA